MYLMIYVKIVTNVSASGWKGVLINMHRHIPKDNSVALQTMSGVTLGLLNNIHKQIYVNICYVFVVPIANWRVKLR